MNKQIFKGQWREIKGKLQEQWSKLSDDDLEKIKANNEEIYGILEKHYGYAKDEIKKSVKEFVNEIGMPNLNVIKEMSEKAWQATRDAIRAHPVRSFFIAVSALTIYRRLTKSTHH